MTKEEIKKSREPIENLLKTLSSRSGHEHLQISVAALRDAATFTIQCLDEIERLRKVLWDIAEIADGVYPESIKEDEDALGVIEHMARRAL